MLYFRILLNNNLVMPRAGKQDATSRSFEGTRNRSGGMEAARIQFVKVMWMSEALHIYIR